MYTRPQELSGFSRSAEESYGIGADSSDDSDHASQMEDDSQEEDEGEIARDLDELMALIDAKKQEGQQPKGQGEGEGESRGGGEGEGGGGRERKEKERRKEGWSKRALANELEEDLRSDDEEVRPVPDNDALFYDPGEDDANQDWVDAQRGERKNKATGQIVRLGHRSDAVLSCPCCFSTLCIDCQRHERHPNQWRAMFVCSGSCNVLQHTTLKSAPKSKRQGKKGKNRAPKDQHAPPVDGGGQGREEVFHPVECAHCKTEVGVLDEDSVYHFFNVAPSQA